MTRLTVRIAVILLASAMLSGSAWAQEAAKDDGAKALADKLAAQEAQANGIKSTPAAPPAVPAAAPAAAPVEPAPAPIASGAVDAAMLRAHYEAGLRSYYRDDFFTAVRELEFVQSIDPNYGLVADYLQKARTNRADKERLEVENDAELRHDEVMTDVEKASSPPRELEPVERPRNAHEAAELTEAQQAMEDRLNQVVTLNMTEADLDYILDVLYRGAGVNFIADPAILAGKKLTLHVNRIPLREVLQYISRSLGVSFTTTENAIWITTPEQPYLKTKAIPLNKGLIDVTAASDAAPTSSDLEKLVAKIPELVDWPTTGGVIQLDKKMNVLYVRATEEAIKQVEDLLTAIDVTPPEVLVESRFVELTGDNLFDFGIQWNLNKDYAISEKNGQDQTVITKDTKTTFAQNFPGASTDGLDFVLQGVLSEPQFKAALHTLQSSGKANTLSAPSVLTVSNHAAEMKVVTNLVYVEDYSVDRSDVSGVSTIGTVGATGTLTADIVKAIVAPDAITDGQAAAIAILTSTNATVALIEAIDSNISPAHAATLLQMIKGIGTTGTGAVSSEPVIIPKFAEVEVGFTLKVLPSIGADNKDISLFLLPEIKEKIDEVKVDVVIPPSVQGGESVTTQVTRPVIATRSFGTQMTVADGATVAIGGLVSRNLTKQVSKVPFLGDLPLIGALFRRTSTADTKTNLLIFVTARIVTPEGRRYLPDSAKAAMPRTGAVPVDPLALPQLSVSAEKAGRK